MLTNKLKEILKERGLKQVWLAEKCNIEKSTLSNIVNNIYQPSIELAFQIADTLGLDIKKVFIYTEDQKNNLKKF